MLNNILFYFLIHLGLFLVSAGAQAEDGRLVPAVSLLLEEKQEAGVVLTDDRLESESQAATVYFDHLLENTGTLTDTYNITVSQLSTDDGDFDTVTVFYVADNDALFNDVLTTTPALLPSETFAIRIQALVPVTAAFGSQYQLTINATSNFDNGVSDANTDTLTVPSPQ